MPKFIIKYFDVIEADDSEQAKDILLEQLMIDVRNDAVEAFDIDEWLGDEDEGIENVKNS